MIPHPRLEYVQIGRGQSITQPVSAEGPHRHPDQGRNRTGDRKKTLHDLLDLLSELVTNHLNVARIHQAL